MNITFCDPEDVKDSVCVKSYVEQIILTIGIIIIVANTIHLTFLSQLRQHKGSVFYKTLRLITCLDILTTVWNTTGMLCLWREILEFPYPAVLLTRSLLAFGTAYFKYWVYLFTISERWLILAKPFQYEHHIFVTKYDTWVGIAAFGSLVFISSLYVIPFFAFSDVICYDKGFGGLFCQASHFYVCSVPVALINLPITIFAILFFMEYVRMRKRRHTRDHDETAKQAAEYVLASTTAYFFNSLFMLVWFSFNNRTEVRELKPLTIMVDQLNGIWNILALYATMKSYREKVAQMIYSIFAKCKPMRKVHPVAHIEVNPVTC